MCGYVFGTYDNAVITSGLLRLAYLVQAISQGAVIWVYNSEIFPTRVRSKGQGLGSGTHWVMNAGLCGVFLS